MKLTKRILSVILTVLLVCQIGAVAFAAKAAENDESEDRFAYKVIDEENKLARILHAYNLDYTGKDFVIPKEIDGYKIVDIGERFDSKLADENGYIDTVTSMVIEAELVDCLSRQHFPNPESYEYGLFERFVNLTSVTLPNSLKKIDDFAFENCKKLERINMPENLEEIGSCAFYNCDNLKDIVFNDKLEMISGNAFYDCDGLTNIVFSNNLKRIGYDAFRSCDNLTDIVLNNKLEVIDNYAFFDCKSLTGKIYFGENISDIGWGAFSYCPGINGFRIAEGNKNFYQKSGVLYNKDQTQLLCYLAGKETAKWTVPSSVEKIDWHAFAGTKNLKKITFTSKIAEISEFAFSGSGIESFSAPKNLKKICEGAFENCKNLKKVKLNSKLEDIWSGAFSGCTKLEGKIEIGKNVDYISSTAFLYCDNLTGFRIADGNKHFSQKSGVLYNKDKTKLIIYLPRKETEKFKVPSTVKLIDSYAFAGSKYLKEITLPSKLKEIPSHAFYKSNIRSITIPGSVRRLYDYCFANSKISSVKFETGKKNLVIRKYAFLNCDKLKSITLPERAYSAYEQAFYDCDNLTKIKVMNPNCSFSRIYSGDDWDTGDRSRLNEDLVVYGKKKSETERWAKEINRSFKEI